MKAISLLFRLSRFAEQCLGGLFIWLGAAVSAGSKTSQRQSSDTINHRHYPQKIIAKPLRPDDQMNASGVVRRQAGLMKWQRACPLQLQLRRRTVRTSST